MADERTTPLRTCEHGIVYGDPCPACARKGEDSPSDKNGDAFLILGYEDTPDFAIARTRDEVRAAILKIMWGGCETDEGRIKEELDEYMEWWDDDDHWCIERSHWSVRFEIGGLEAWRFPAKILTPVFAGCGCIETYPQLVPGKVSHGPGCALSAASSAVPAKELFETLEWLDGGSDLRYRQAARLMRALMFAPSSEWQTFEQWWAGAGFKQYHAVGGETVARAAWIASKSHERSSNIMDTHLRTARDSGHATISLTDLMAIASLINDDPGARQDAWNGAIDAAIGVCTDLNDQAEVGDAFDMAIQGLRGLKLKTPPPAPSSATTTNEGESMDTPTPHSDNLRTLRARVGGYLAPAEHDELERAAALLELAFPALLELGHRIEKCGASPELTHAVTLCSDLRAAIGNRWNRADRQAEERVRADLARDDVKREINERIHQEDRAAGRDNAAQRGT